MLGFHDPVNAPEPEPVISSGAGFTFTGSVERVAAMTPMNAPPMSARPRIPAPLARRIDRLARRAHAFHRFAHHPLCAAYERELVPLGRRARICRGCLFAFAGGATGLAFASAAPRAPVTAVAALALAAALGVVSLRLRLPKVLSRFLPSALGGFALGGGIGPAAAAAASGAAYVLWHRSRGPDRRPCDACPERAVTVCSGYAPIVRRERAFGRLASRWLRRSACTTR